MLKRSPRSDDVWGRHMDDYSALAYRIAGGVADVRGCLILSRDGLILGSYPDDETAVKPAWVQVRFARGPRAQLRRVRRPGLGLRQTARVRCIRRGQRRRPSGPGDRPARGHPDLRRGVPEPSRHAPRARGVGWTARASRRRRPTSSRRTATRPRPRRLPTAPRLDIGPGPPSPPWTARPPRPPRRRWPRLPAVSAARGMRPVRRGPVPTRRMPSSPPRTAPGEEGRRRSEGHGDVRLRPGRDGRRRTLSDTNERNGTDKPPPMELDADAEVDPVMLAKEFSGLLQVESGDDEVSS